MTADDPPCVEGAAIPMLWRRDPSMDGGRLSAKQAKGAVKDAVGKVTGDAKLQAGDKAEIISPPFVYTSIITGINSILP